MENKTFTLNLSTQEFLFLAALIGARDIIGKEDPFLLDTKEIINEKWIYARDSLAEKGYISYSETGGVLIDHLVASVISVCAEPEICLVITSTCTDAAYKTNFYISTLMAVELYSSSTDNNTLLLYSTLPEISVRIQELFKNAQCMTKDNSCIKSISIPDSVYDQFLSQTKDSQTDSAASLLVQTGIDKETSEAVSLALSSPAVQTTFFLLENMDEIDVTGKGFALIGGNSGIWKIAPSDDVQEDFVDILPCTYEMLQEETQFLIDKISSVYLFDDTETLEMWNELLSPLS